MVILHPNNHGHPVPRGRASHTSRLPRVVRWLGEKKGTALQSIVVVVVIDNPSSDFLLFIVYYTKINGIPQYNIPCSDSKGRLKTRASYKPCVRYVKSTHVIVFGISKRFCYF